MHEKHGTSEAAAQTTRVAATRERIADWLAARPVPNATIDNNANSRRHSASETAAQNHLELQPRLEEANRLSKPVPPYWTSTLTFSAANLENIADLADETGMGVPRPAGA